MKKYIFSITLIILYTTIVCGQNLPWLETKPMPTPRYGMCSVVYRGEVWVIGGADGEERSLKTVEVFDPVNHRWDTNSIPQLNIARYNAASVVYEDKIYVMGGRDSTGTATSSVEVFDPQLYRWLIFKELQVPREALNAIIYRDRMYAIGGFGSSENVYLANNEYWDVENSEWMPDIEWSLRIPRVSMESIVINDIVYTLGGNYFGPVSIVERYQEGVGTALLSSMSTPRYEFAAVAIDDTILVIGGLSETDVIPGIESFIVTNNKWRSDEIAYDLPRSGLNAIKFENFIFTFGGKSYDNEVLDIVNFALIDSVESTGMNYIKSDVPPGFTLFQNYPNPFNSSTKIGLRIPQQFTGLVRLDIINVRGVIVDSYIHENGGYDGHIEFTWNGKDMNHDDVSSGVYFYRLRTGDTIIAVRKMMVIR